MSIDFIIVVIYTALNACRIENKAKNTIKHGEYTELNMF
jgi:hypothetical protein